MRDGDPAGPDGPGADGDHRDDQRSESGDATGAGPGELLGDLTQLRRRTRLARHGYWFPLVLFGVLGCAAAPLYLAAAASTPAGSGAFQTTGAGPLLLSGMPMGTKGFYIGWYWTVALVAGFLLTVLWYWRAARRAGVRTPSRGYLITGVVLTVLAVLLPPLSRAVPRLFLGWNPAASRFGWNWTVLPDILLPALVLLASGIGALLVQRLRRPA